MQVFRVEHRSGSRSYFVEAEDATLAIERVTLALADLEGLGAWAARPAEGGHPLPSGEVVDEMGKPVKPMNA